MRFRAQHSPRSDATTMNSLVSPSRNRLSQTFQQPAQDPRSNLSRRFTTDSGRVPTLSSNMAPRGPEQEYQVRGDCSSSVRVLRSRLALPAPFNAQPEARRRRPHLTRYTFKNLTDISKAGYATITIGVYCPRRFAVTICPQGLQAWWNSLDPACTLPAEDDHV